MKNQTYRSHFHNRVDSVLHEMWWEAVARAHPQREYFINSMKALGENRNVSTYPTFLLTPISPTPNYGVDKLAELPLIMALINCS